MHANRSDIQARRDALEARKPITAPCPCPCPCLTGPGWEKMRESAIALLDEFGDEAAAFGWTTLQLFGVHPVVGIIQLDFCGALVMSGSKVTALTATRMAFGNTAFYRDTPGRPPGPVPLWAFRS